jgi:predicted house-cleaning noncanonical NTP pyrophosphatase (MazG superfamily)
MASKLSNHNQKVAKVCFAFTIVALVLRKLKEIAEMPDDQEDPAISQCIALIDDILEALPTSERNLVVERINHARVSFTKNVRTLPAEAGLIGCLEVVTSGMFKTKVGTRLDYIVATFKSNLEMIREHTEYDERQAKAFAAKFKATINRI